LTTNLYADLRAAIVAALLDALPDLPPEVTERVEVTPNRDAALGDMASNAALVTAKAARRKPADIAAMVVAALLVTWWLRNGRFGAYLQAVRDNEDAARAVGVNPFRIKLAAIGISAAFMGAAGAFYVQVFQYIDAGIAYGSLTSVEALVAAIVGGMGTLWGPVLGAAVLHLLSDLTRNLFGELPGINMVIYGSVLVLIVIFLPRGIAGLGLSVRQLWNAKGGRHD